MYKAQIKKKGRKNEFVKDDRHYSRYYCDDIQLQHTDWRTWLNGLNLATDCIVPSHETIVTIAEIKL